MWGIGGFRQCFGGIGLILLTFVASDPISSEIPSVG